SAIGIDLGMTFTTAAFYDDRNRVVVMRNLEGHIRTPSVVHISDNRILVGEEALLKQESHPRATISEIKGLIGRDSGDAELKSRRWPFELISNSKGKACVRVGGLHPRVYTPEEILAHILKYAQSFAKQYLESPSNAVITVPCSFTNQQREATRDAGILAGLHVLKIIDEPIAAAHAFCHTFPMEQIRKILVYDLGKKEFVASIADHDKILSTGKYTFLGGEDFDFRIFEESQSIFSTMGVDVDEENSLMKTSELAKKTLTNQQSARIDYTNKNGNVFGFDLTNNMFLDTCQDLFDKTLKLVDEVLKSAKLNKKDVNGIVLVGGATRMRHVRNMLSDKFPGTPILTEIEPETVVAQGAAIIAARLNGDSRIGLIKNNSDRKSLATNQANRATSCNAELVFSSGRFNTEFSREREVGKGTFGRVFQAKHRNDECDYAVKRIAVKHSVDLIKKALREVQTMAKLHHCGIVRYHNAWIEKDCDDGLVKDSVFIFIQMEYCDQSLAAWLYKTSYRNPVRMRFWFKQIVNALKYIHNKRIIHRDLKPCNILVDSNVDFEQFENLKICDLGIAKYLNDDQHTHTFNQGTPMYSAPEQCAKYDQRVDIFSSGLILLEMCEVMTTDQKSAVFKEIRCGKYVSVLNDQPHTLNLVTQLVRLDPDRRPSFDNIRRHPFFSN
ncbi:hypothetical protein PENTCL1PPCAC_12915, partial [Pristionchus entomophagus]